MISPTSCQTPVEPEANYRYKSSQHHKGHDANIVETIEKIGKQEEPIVLVADEAYDFEDARNLGKNNGVDLVNAELKGRSPNPAYAGILIDEEKKTKVLMISPMMIQRANQAKQM